MRRIFLLIASVVVLSLLSGCVASHSYSGKQSAFMSSFSADPLLEKVAPDIRSTSGKSIENREVMSVWNNSRIFHNEYEIHLDVLPAGEERLMLGLKAEIKTLIQGSGAKILGEEDGVEHFNFSYTDGSNHCWIEVWGVRDKDDVYRIMILLNERS